MSSSHCRETRGRATERPETDLDERAHKVIITGTGRAGTTFLVRLLTELGLDTGFTRDQWKSCYEEHCKAGLEFDLEAPNTPRIVKNPRLCETLPGLLATGRFAIDHAIIPMRDLDSAARSRISIGGVANNIPGGLWGTSNPKDQRAVLADRFHQLLHTLAVYDIPHTLILFPRMVEDADYLYDKLSFLLEEIDREMFVAVFARVADRRLVHRFDQKSAIPDDVSQTSAVREYSRAQRRRSLHRWTRRGRRVLAFAAGMAAVLSAERAGLVNFSWIPAIDARLWEPKTEATPVSADYNPDDEPVAVSPPETGSINLVGHRFERGLIESSAIGLQRFGPLGAPVYRRPVGAEVRHPDRTASFRPFAFIDPFQAMKSSSGPEFFQ